MDHSFQVTLFLILIFIFRVAGRPVKPPPDACHVSLPILNSEVLDLDNNGRSLQPFWTVDARQIEDSGGTRAYNPGVTASEEHGIFYPWVAPNAERLSAMNPNRTGQYYREQVVSLTTYPWNTIGRVFFKRFQGDQGGWCSGSLVGRDLMLTASHCFPWDYGPNRSMRFAPGCFNKSEPYGSSYVSKCRGVKNTFNVTGIDYIVCHLCDPLGDLTGWMGTKWWQDAEVYMGRGWNSSGYPVDSFQGEAQMLLSNVSLINVDLHGEQGKELETNVFASSGWSGGPMWDYIDGEPKVVGVCSGGEKDCSEQVGGCTGEEDESTYHDVSAGGKLMTELVLYGMAHWKVGS